MKNTKSGGLKPVPILGSIYYFFDDGKITKSRRFEVEVTDVIPFDKIDDRTLSAWRAHVEECGGWGLCNEKTDYFVVGTIKDERDDVHTKLTFARSKCGWFSFGNYLFDGGLDIDCSLNSRLNDS